MKATVVVPTHGGAVRLPRLLNSLAAQTHADWDAIIVIDGDGDGSEAVVARYAHLPVRTIVFPENRGRVAALNAGLSAARGDVLIRADDDFELSPTHVAAHLAPHRREECGVVGLPRNIAPPSRYMRVYGLPADRRGRDEAHSLSPGARWRLWGGNVSIRRSTFERIGGYDHRYRGYGWEDFDFGYRLAQAGVPIVLADDAEVLHYLASTSTEARVRRALASGAARSTFDSIHGMGASGPAAPVPSTRWNQMVGGLSDRLSPRTAGTIARGIDALLPVIPESFGRRAIGLLVEASGAAGYRLAPATASDRAAEGRAL
ncbi:MAG: glycosyltransferase family A protein [Mycetocola sp.]